MPDTQNAWTGFDVPDNEIAGSLLWLAVFYDAMKREPKDYAYDVICDNLKCTHYADKRGITKEKKVVQEINAITERLLDQRFGVLRLGQNYSKPNSSPSEENKEANGNE